MNETRGWRERGRAARARSGGALLVLAAALFAVVLAGCSRGGGGGAVEAGPWCVEHSVPEAQDPICHPGTAPLDISKDWCAEHAVPESRCVRCNKNAAHGLEPGDWCREHGVPESGCTICHPDLAQKGAEAGGAGGERDAAPADAAALLITPEVSIDTAVPVPEGCLTEAMQIRFASADIPARAGITLARVDEAPLPAALRCVAETEYNGNRYARLPARAAAIVRVVKADLGDVVREGEALAVLSSSEMAETRAAYLEARARLLFVEKSFERERALAEQGIASRQALDAAETEREAARLAVQRAAQSLETMGVGAEERHALDESGAASSEYIVAAPFAGAIVERQAVVGQSVGADDVLFEMANLSEIWARLDIPERELSAVRVGLPVEFAPDGGAFAPVRGRLTWISPAVDPHSRTVEARAVFENRGGGLRAGVLGTGTVGLGGRARAFVVPRDAVQWEGCCYVVFVQEGAARFLPRRIALGREMDGGYEVLGGLNGGEIIAVAGSFLLKTELMKESIGAGCCDAVAQEGR